MTRRFARQALYLLPLAFAASPALAQEEEFKPSNEQLNEELDSSLRKEFEEPPPPPPPPPPPDYDEDDDDEDEDDDDLGFRLGGLVAHYVATMDRVRVSHRDGRLGGERIELTADGFLDYDVEHLQTYGAWLDLGRHVSLQGGFRRGVFRDAAPTPTTFRFGRSVYTRGQVVDSTIDALTADLDLVIKPINNRWVELALHLGSRYMFWRTELTGPGVNRETSTLEAAVPMIGAGLAVRPFRWWELFARARVGYLEYDRPESYRRRNGRVVERVEAKEKLAKTAELDLGTQFLIEETIGVIVGVRMDWLHMERIVDGRSERAQGGQKGVYAGLVLQF